MSRQIFTELCGYDGWATERIFNAALELPVEVLNRRTGAGYGSIFDSLVHLVSADVVWLARLNGSSPTSMLQPSAFPSLKDVHARWRMFQDDMETYLSALPPDGPENLVHYANTRGETFTRPVRQILLHMVNHGTHHRSELSEMLTIAGMPPGSLDLHNYLSELTDKS